MTTVLRFATRTPPIPVTVDTFETRRPETSPKVTTALGFATRTPPILVTVDTFLIRNVKSDDSSAFRDNFSSPASPMQVRHFANACERLRTLANACVHKRNDLASPPGPLDPNLETRTFCYAFGKKESRRAQMSEQTLQTNLLNSGITAHALTRTNQCFNTTFPFHSPDGGQRVPALQAQKPIKAGAGILPTNSKTNVSRAPCQKNMELLTGPSCTAFESHFQVS